MRENFRFPVILRLIFARAALNWKLMSLAEIDLDMVEEAGKKQDRKLMRKKHAQGSLTCKKKGQAVDSVIAKSLQSKSRVSKHEARHCIAILAMTAPNIMVLKKNAHPRLNRTMTGTEEKRRKPRNLVMPNIFIHFASAERVGRRCRLVSIDLPRYNTVEKRNLHVTQNTWSQDALTLCHGEE